MHLPKYKGIIATLNPDDSKNFLQIYLGRKIDSALTQADEFNITNFNESSLCSFERNDDVCCVVVVGHQLCEIIVILI